MGLAVAGSERGWGRKKKEEMGFAVNPEKIKRELRTSH